jgi:hypothetical protein
VVEYSPHYPKVKCFRTATTTAGVGRDKMVKYFVNRASSRSKVVNLPHHHKVKGSRTTTTAGTVREKMEKTVVTGTTALAQR